MIDFLPTASNASALSAHRIRMDIISQNIANANTTRGLDGNPYQRQQVVFETVLNQQINQEGASSLQEQLLKVTEIQKDTRPPIMVYNPGHPDADPQGMVSMPNVNIHEEMVDLIAASRTYEANLVAIRNARNMVLQTLSIGRRG